MSREWIVHIVEHLPQALLSRAWGWLARRRRPRLGVEALKRLFVGAAGIDVGEAEQPLRDYPCLQDLFVRRLRPGARRVAPAPEAVACPVDGAVGACGTVDNGTLLQVKGRTYSLERLLDGAEDAQRFDGGAYATFYLSPRDYHRVHAPLSGRVSEAVVVPGFLLPVFPAAVESVAELFARNERLITFIDTVDAGRLAVVKVGATLVGHITVSYDPDVHTNTRGRRRRRLHYDPPRLVHKGAELGAFALGSSVVLVAEPGRVAFKELAWGQRVRMGQRIGTVRTQATRSAATGTGRGRRRGARAGQAVERTDSHHRRGRS